MTDRQCTARYTGEGTLTARKPEHVLNERREHVPGLKMDQGANEVEPVGGSKRDDNITECSVGLDEAMANFKQKDQV